MTQSKLQYMHPDDIVPYYNNPRHNQDAVGPVAESIKAFGFKAPIVVDENLEVITGHTRLKAAKQLGLDKVPVIVAEDLDEDQVRAYRLADNKVAELASWDDEKLLDELATAEARRAKSSDALAQASCGSLSTKAGRAMRSSLCPRSAAMNWLAPSP